MPKFIIINNPREMPVPSCGWTNAHKFRCEDRVVNDKGEEVETHFLGRKYRLVAKFERKFSLVERVCRAFVGAVLVIISLSTLLTFKNVKLLFTKDKVCKRYGIPYVPVIQEEKEIIEEDEDQFFDCE